MLTKPATRILTIYSVFHRIITQVIIIPRDLRLTHFNLCLTHFNVQSKKRSDWSYQCYALIKKKLMKSVPVVELPYRSRVVALCPPGLGWVEVSTPQLPVKALSGQRVLLDLERVVFDVVKGWRHNPRPVLLDSLQDRFCPAGQGRVKGNVF